MLDVSRGTTFTYTCLQVLLLLVWWLHPFRDWIYVDTMKILQLGQWRNTYMHKHMHTHMLSCLLPCKLPPFIGRSPDTPTAINSCSFCLPILVQLKVNLFTGWSLHRDKWKEVRTLRLFIIKQTGCRTTATSWWEHPVTAEEVTVYRCVQ